ncbi:hypothetical protein CYLTODRAFT_424198 [Cylindrobasidium torrendii FP15055 ss-10]|uniref:Uncharacterized protein n=1 Tax=Cylindrobasidium torrendii FP15055 ss-10 TaxID=1314674 RepID=A0A0D7B5Z3_9AGAR|nr:hypothetical protein CYLTODRAFT_424198 [Cylindrobasidium torrendii FP15055 ss-10]
MYNLFGRRNTTSSVSSKHLSKLIRSYAPDWLLTLVLAAIFFTLEKYVGGYKRVFSLSDTSLRHPYAEHERVPVRARLSTHQ